MPDTTVTERPRTVDEVTVANTRVGRFDYKWVALAVVLTGTIMTILDATIVNIAIPTLQHDLHAGSYTDIAWVVTGYLLAQGAVIPLSGWATDRWGTKKLYLITIVTFTVASMLCGVSQNLGELIFFRVVQGIGGGMLMPIGMTIILQAVGPQQMGRVMGIFGVPMLIAPAVGPVLGGWFVQDFSWRLIFYVNVPIGIIGFLAATRFLRESHRTARLRLDVVGLLTGVPAVLALMYAVDRSTDLGWTSAVVISLLVASALLMCAFVLRQLRAREPLLQLTLFRDRTFSWAMAISFVVVTAMFGTMLLLPLYLQEVHGYDAIETGLLLLPQAAMAAVSMPLGGYLTDRLGPKWVVATGMILLTLGSVLLAQIHYNSSNWLVISALMLRGFAMGFAMMPTMSAALARVPRRYASRASSITNTLQRLSSSVGIAVLVTVLAGQFTTAAKQTTCAPPAAVVVAAANTLHQPALSAQQYCAVLQEQDRRFVRAGKRGQYAAQHWQRGARRVQSSVRGRRLQRRFRPHLCPDRHPLGDRDHPRILPQATRARRVRQQLCRDDGLGPLRGSIAGPAISLGALVEQDVDVLGAELVEMSHQRAAQRRHTQLRMRVRTRHRLGDELVDEPDVVRRGNAGSECGGSTGPLPCIAVQNRRAGLGRGNRVHGVLQRQHPISQRQCQRSSRSPLAENRAHHGDAQFQHGDQRLGDRPCLAPFLGADPGVGCRGVDETDNRHAELLGGAHEPLRLAISLGVRHPEVVQGTTDRVGSLLLADDHDPAIVEPCRPAHHSSVVAEQPVATQLRPFGERSGDHLQRAGTAGVARQLDGGKSEAFPFGGVGGDSHWCAENPMSSRAIVLRRMPRSTTASTIP